MIHARASVTALERGAPGQQKAPPAPRCPGRIRPAGARRSWRTNPPEARRRRRATQPVALCTPFFAVLPARRPAGATARLPRWRRKIPGHREPGIPPCLPGRTCAPCYEPTALSRRACGSASRPAAWGAGKSPSAPRRRVSPIQPGHRSRQRQFLTALRAAFAELSACKFRRVRALPPALRRRGSLRRARAGLSGRGLSGVVMRYPCAGVRRTSIAPSGMSGSGICSSSAAPESLQTSLPLKLQLTTV